MFGILSTLLNAQRGKSLTTVTRIRLTLILVWIVLVLPGNGKGAEDCGILLGSQTHLLSGGDPV